MYTTTSNPACKQRRLSNYFLCQVEGSYIIQQVVSRTELALITGSYFYSKNCLKLFIYNMHGLTMHSNVFL
jgi:hypothetical protein